MACDERLNPTTILLFIGVLSSQIGRGWRVRGESTPAGREGQVTPTSPSSLHHLFTHGSTPGPTISSLHRPPTPSWLLPPHGHVATDSAPAKVNTSDVAQQSNLKSITNTTSSFTSSSSSSSSHHHLIGVSPHTPVLSTQTVVKNALQKVLSKPHKIHNKHIEKDSLLKLSQQPKLPPQGKTFSLLSNDTEALLSDTGQLEANQSSSQIIAKQDVTKSGENRSSIHSARDEESLLKTSSLDGSEDTGGNSRRNSNNGSSQGDVSSQIFTEQTDHRNDTITSPNNLTSSTDFQGDGKLGEQEEEGEMGRELLPSHNSSSLQGEPGDGKWEGEEMLAEDGAQSQQNISPSVNFTTSHDHGWVVEETLYGKAKDLNVSLSEGRTNLTFNESLPGGSEAGRLDVWGNVSYVYSNSSISQEEYDDEDDNFDEEDDRKDENGSYYYTDDSDQRSGAKSDWIYDEDYDEEDYDDDDYEYDTKDDEVEDMRPGGDNYYRGAKISDDEWIRERSKMDMNEAASHPGQEVFVGPHSFEAEFGPISEVRSETMEMHQPFVPESSHDASLSILVFYTWIGIVTVMVIGAFIALKHRHRIANYVWDARTGYRKKGTVCATEEGRNLLTTVM